MLAIPTQTEEELLESVKNVISLNPNHISVYSLILEEGTELEKQVSSGILKLLDEDIERKMYWKTKKILEKNGYKHYEISNFAKKGFESKHNLDCWNQEEYLGVGLAAHSYINNKRFSNTNNFEEYVKNIKQENYEKNVQIHEVQEREEKAKEYMMLGLRKIEGISISEFERKFRINPLFYFRFEIEKLTNEELIEVDLDKIKLTKKGLDLANLVFEEFI
jgi:oxygen-independent coproporphyrinogen-3 oxidase